MNTVALGSLAIVGVVVSLLTQWLKSKFTTYRTQVYAVGLSIVAGAVYFFLKMHTNLLADILSVLATAEIVYAYLLQYLENPTPIPPAPPQA